MAVAQTDMVPWRANSLRPTAGKEPGSGNNTYLLVQRTLSQRVRVDARWESKPEVIAATRNRKRSVGQIAAYRTYHGVAVLAIFVLHLLGVRRQMAAFTELDDNPLCQWT